MERFAAGLGLRRQYLPLPEIKFVARFPRALSRHRRPNSFRISCVVGWAYAVRDVFLTRPSVISPWTDGPAGGLGKSRRRPASPFAAEKPFASRMGFPKLASAGKPQAVARSLKPPRLSSHEIPYAMLGQAVVALAPGRIL